MTLAIFAYLKEGYIPKDLTKNKKRCSPQEVQEFYSESDGLLYFKDKRKEVDLQVTISNNTENRAWQIRSLKANNFVARVFYLVYLRLYVGTFTTFSYPVCVHDMGPVPKG